MGDRSPCTQGLGRFAVGPEEGVAGDGWRVTRNQQLVTRNG